MREMELRVMRRLAEDASTPAYQALMTVRRRPKERTATQIPQSVSPVRSLCLSRLRKTNLRSTCQNPLFQVQHGAGLSRGPRIVGYHDDRLARLPAQSLHEP